MHIDCKCKLKTDLKYLIAVPGCSDDLAAVTSLPQEWTPRRSGPILKKYLEKREQDHNNVNSDIKREADAVNDDIDAQVRSLAEILLADIKNYQQDIECKLKESKPIDVLSLERRNDCFKLITGVFSRWTQSLVQFKQEALGLERQRIDGLKSVLKKQFQNLVEVGHKSPKDLLHEFDERLYAINQQLISNCRAYTELEAQLRNQADTYIIRIRSSLNEMCLEKTSYIRGRSALPWMNESIERKRSSSLELETVKKTSGASPGTNMEEFKGYVAHLVQAYRAAIIKLCTDFSGQLKNLQEEMDNYLYVEKPRKSVLSKIQTTIDQAFDKFSNSFTESKARIEKLLLDIAFNDVVNMQKSLCHFGDRLQSTYAILRDAGYLWDGHILRSALVQKLIITGVEDMMTAHDSIEQANEVVFNIGLEQLQVASDSDKLQQQFDNLKTMLNKIEEVYQQHYEMEVKKVEEYMNLPLLMTNIMLAEYECFFEKYPKCPLNSDQSLNSSPDLASPRRQTLISLRAPLPRVVLQTHLQDVALYNWRNGFLESLQNNVPLVEVKINCQARRWIDERTMQVNMRYSLKLMSHSVRLERLKAAREARLAELKSHEYILASHLSAMNKLVDKLPIEIAGYLGLDSPELYPLTYWAGKIQSDLDQLLASDPDPEKKRLKMSSYAPRLLMYRRNFEESLDNAIETYKKNIQHRLQSARIATFHLVSDIKLPVEGGSYAASEAVKATAAVVKACDAFEVCANRSMDLVHQRRQQILVMADQLLSPLNRVVDEGFKFNKNKPAAPTKKR
ncbi:unnamed protein product [Pieris brassicae]|uniref:DUF4455 domain-containing protein n=1 Tax=Pieris brassicae TaxID=7116 RepID=A0A9P0T1J9_PIEBR|nr:unnamed protein product [Pieris brassicae]